MCTQLQYKKLDVYNYNINFLSTPCHKILKFCHCHFVEGVEVVTCGSKTRNYINGFTVHAYMYEEFYAHH